MRDDTEFGRVLESKDDLVRLLDSEVRGRFGEDVFVAEGERLASNHVVYTGRTDPGLWISVVAGGEGQDPDAYSLQVETNVGEPNFDIPFVGDNLSLHDVLEVFERFQPHA